MPSQAMYMFSVGGANAEELLALVASISCVESQADVRVDRLLDAMLANRRDPSILYFSEWTDRWLMGDDLIGPEGRDGTRSSIRCFDASAVDRVAASFPDQYEEHKWYRARLLEASSACGMLVQRRAILVARSILGPSVEDSTIREASSQVAPWLAVVAPTSPLRFRTSGETA